MVDVKLYSALVFGYAHAMALYKLSELLLLLLNVKPKKFLTLWPGKSEFARIQ